MMMSALVAGVCAYIVSMLPCTGPSFTPYICSLFHVMYAPPGWCSFFWNAHHFAHHRSCSGVMAAEL